MGPYEVPVLLPAGGGLRLNRTLHGRSRFRKEDVPGHNVFRGYLWPGWNDALDIFLPAGTPIVALEACRQTQHYNDETKLEVIRLLGDGLLVVLAHVNAKHSGVGHGFARGDVVGYVGRRLLDPHVHIEVLERRDGHEVPLVGRTPGQYLDALRELCGR